MATNKYFDPGKSYRLLAYDEPIQEGDEFWDFYHSEWIKVVGVYFTKLAGDSEFYLRRKIEASKPAVDTSNKSASKAFNIAASLLLGLIQQYPNNYPPADELMKLVERFKRLRDGNDNIS
jgi:hypothetical protein